MTMTRNAMLAAVMAVVAGCAAPEPAPASRAGIAQPDASGLPVPSPCADENDWSEATGPRHVFGNTWYVGSCGISVLLIATPEGHVLIDAATAQAAPAILANLRALGVDPRDVRYLLSSHEHLDHVGGSAQLQAATGAPLYARRAGVAALRRGRGDRSDPQLGSTAAFTPIADVRELTGDSVTLAGVRITAHATPGHTPGATSWSWDSCEDERCLHMVYADSISALADDQYRYADHPRYVAAFRDGLDHLATLSCDVLLTPHPGASNLWPRLRGEAPLANTDACKAYASKGRAGLDARLATEAGKPTP